MKQFDVYSIGNALLDYDFEVTPKTLERLGIDKGVMTLIDEARERELMEELDGIKHVKASGGSAANTMIAIQQLTGQTFFSCKVANDAAGDFYYQDLIKSGATTNLAAHNRPEGTTGKCVVMVTPDADRTMNTFLGISEQVSMNEVMREALIDSKYLYLEGFLITSPTGLDALIQSKRLAEEHGVKTALTLADPNMVKFFKPALLDVIGSGVDLLFCNEAEAELFTDCHHMDLICDALKSFAKTFVITLGGEGAVVYDGEQITHVPGYPTKAVDTVGAGDMFAGAFLYGITHGHSYPDAAKFANFAAARVVSKIGPRLTLDEAITMKTEFAPTAEGSALV